MRKILFLLSLLLLSACGGRRAQVSVIPLIGISCSRSASGATQLATTYTEAIQRAGTKSGNKGYDVACSAIEMVNLIKAIG